MSLRSEKIRRQVRPQPSEGVQLRDDPPRESYINRIYHSSVAFGNYVFIDGGEIKQSLDGTVYQSTVNSTLSIDMSKSWSPFTVQLKEQSKGDYPRLNGQTLWPSPDKTAVYAFGGESNFFSASTAPEKALWQFQVSQNGSIEWSEVELGANSGFPSIDRPSVALTATLGDTEYFIGGHQNRHTQPETSGLDEDVTIGGIASFNATSTTWNNDTTPFYGGTDLIAPVPIFGPRGLVVLLRPEQVGAGQDSPPWDNITVYDPSSKEWTYQAAGGEIPSSRQSACAVGINEDLTSYEIFVYGGSQYLKSEQILTSEQTDANFNLDQVYVLSIPAFTWFKADYKPAHPRFMHTCQAVGRRQMLSVGGKDPREWGEENGDPGGKATKDAVPQGLGVFDLSMMRWNTTGFNVDDEPYVRPNVVAQWYKDNDVEENKDFDDITLRNYFYNSTTLANEASGTTSGQSTSDNDGSALSGGAIAGIVIGCIAGLLLLLVAAWFLRRFFKNRREKALQGEGTYYDPKSNPPSYAPPEEMAADRKLHELHGRQNGTEVAEMGGQAFAEMDGGIASSELGTRR